MRALITVLLFIVAGMAFAIDRGSEFSDPELEARFQKLNDEFRCLVCQNQTLADSNAGLAADLRDQVKRLLEEGKSDPEISAYMVARYGDFVLYKPPVKSTTWLLWIGPFLLLSIAFFALFSAIRRQAQLPDADSPDEDTTP